MKKKIILLFCLILIFSFTSCKKKKKKDDGTYTISYTLNGGIVDNNPITYTINDDFILHNPTKDGYLFTGWSTNENNLPKPIIHITKGNSGDLSFIANFIPYPDDLKVCVFADVQLTTERNQDQTINSLIALKSHLLYAKSIDADVLLMDGDIVNNAVRGYYELFKKTFIEVYGLDESTYPEFVMNMGNHEWWDLNEKDTADAVKLFKDYARIETDNLIRKSEVLYYVDHDSTIPTYYKVINGIPFIVISGIGSSGVISKDLKNEISSWLIEISELESVKNGGPIFVSYHTPLLSSTYDGENASYSSVVIDELFANYPNAIVFTGDTHFNSVNERTINQVNFTTINIGSSSYSRNMSQSATAMRFDNVLKMPQSKGTALISDIDYLHQYNPTLMVASIDNQYNTSINRYITNLNPDRIVKVNDTWNITTIKSNKDFIYTNERINNKEWSNKLYGKDGLQFSDECTLQYGINGNKMIISFDDVIDYHFCEHYLIKLINKSNPSNFVTYDYMSNYFKYNSNSSTNHIIIENFPIYDDYILEVEAYDFFDNLSLNTLYCDSISNILLPDDEELKIVQLYSPISHTSCYDLHSLNSNSSIMYYANTTNNITSGISFCTLIDSNSSNNIILINDLDNTLSIDVYNPNDYELKFDLILEYKNNGITNVVNLNSINNGIVLPSSNWTTITWNLSELNIDKTNISALFLKVNVPPTKIDINNGCEITFYVDNIEY